MAFVVVLAVACALRFVHLGRFSLWLDEAATWWNATRPGLLATVFAEPNHPPVWWLVTRASIALFGDGEAALRAPAAACGVLAVGLGALLARRLFAGPAAAGADGFGGRPPLPGNERAATLAFMALAATSGFLVEYAQEARMYSCLLAESLGLSLLLFDWLDHRRTTSLIAYGALAIVALLTHYFALLPMAGHAAFVLLRAWRRREDTGRTLRFLAVQCVCGLVLALWLFHTLAVPHGVAAGGRFTALPRLAYSLWRMAAGPALAAIDRPRIDAGLAAFVRDEWATIALSALAFGVPFVIGLTRLRRHPEARAFLACGIVVPIVGLLAVQSRLPLMHEKYLIFVAPLLLLVATLGAFAAPARGRALLLAGLALLHLAGVVAYHAPDVPLVEAALVHGHPDGHEDWREVRARIAQRKGVTVYLSEAYLDRPWSYYDRGRTPTVPLPYVESDSLGRAHIESTIGNAPGFFVFAHDRDADRAADLLVLARASGTSADSLAAKMELFPRGWGIRLLAWPPLD